MSENIELHKEVFEYLMEKRREYPDLYFTLNTNIKELGKGYLFTKYNNKNISFSFWLFNGVFLNISLNGILTLDITILDNNDPIYNKLQNELNLRQTNNVTLLKNYGEWKSGLDLFIEKEKLYLDEFAKNIGSLSVDKNTFNYWLKQIKHFGFYVPDDKPQKNFKLNSKLKIESISLKNIGHFEEISLNFSRVTILIGENGSGKSTILRAIALALAGTNFFDLDKDFKKEKNKILNQFLRIENYENAKGIYAEKGEIELNLSENIALKIDFEPSKLVEGKVEATENDQESRLQVLEGKFFKQTFIAFSQSQKTISSIFENSQDSKPQITDLFPLISSSSPNITENLVEWIYYYIHEKQDEKPVEMLFKVLSKIVSHEVSLKKSYKTEGVVGSPNGEKNIIVCTPESPEGINLNLVSQGYHNIFRWVGGIIMKLFSVQGFQEQTDIQKISAVVLIDEIDTYLHPKWQATILKVLVEEFPNIQFVVTTHSELVLSGFEKENIYHISKEGVLQPYSNTLGMDSSSILRITNSAFREPKTQNLIDEIEVLIEENDLENAQSKLSELKNINSKILEIKQFESLIRLKNNSENATHSQK